MLIFISSTFVDLRPEREAAKEALLLIGFNAGSLIPESPELTYTRAEFDLAQKLGRPVFPFFRTDGGRG